MLNTSDGFPAMLMLVTFAREPCFMVADSVSVLGVGWGWGLPCCVEKGRGTRRRGWRMELEGEEEGGCTWVAK